MGRKGKETAPKFVPMRVRVLFVLKEWVDVKPEILEILISVRGSTVEEKEIGGIIVKALACAQTENVVMMVPVNIIALKLINGPDVK